MLRATINASKYTYVDPHLCILI